MLLQNMQTKVRCLRDIRFSQRHEQPRSCPSVHGDAKGSRTGTGAVELNDSDINQIKSSVGGEEAEYNQITRVGLLKP